jgi:hypothetical protein
MDLVLCPYCKVHSHTKYLYTEVVLCSQCKEPISKNIKSVSQEKIATKPQEQRYDLTHTSFLYLNQHYQITGYIRYFYTEGYLYQWAAYNHNTYIWLCECMGEWFILKPAKQWTTIPVATLRVENVFNFKGVEYTVDELSLFYTYYMEGELPDFNYSQTKGISIECSNKNELVHFNLYSNNEIEMFTGQMVHLKELNIKL